MIEVNLPLTMALPQQIALRSKQFKDLPFYSPEPGLWSAFKVSQCLPAPLPLLITGDPGCGKTEFAFWLALRLELIHEQDGEMVPTVHRFDTTTVATGNDLFYHFDALRMFQAAQQREKQADPKEYVTYRPLGQAILESQPWSEVHDQYLWPGSNTCRRPNKESWIPRRSVVLIDEIDKAPRDFPNDLLARIEKLYFSVPELGNVKSAKVNEDFRPYIIITSNSESALPEAFLRRCAYYHIDKPDEEKLKNILERRGLRPDLNQPAFELFIKTRDEMQLLKPPSTAELIQWMQLLNHLRDSWRDLKEPADQAIESSLSLLLKNKEDRKAVVDCCKDNIKSLLRSTKDEHHADSQR